MLGPHFGVFRLAASTSRYDTPSVRRRTTAFLLVAVTLSAVVFAPPTSSSARVRACAAQVPAVTGTRAALESVECGDGGGFVGLTTDQLNTSTSSGAPFRSSLTRDTAWLGHWPTHTPQPMHLSSRGWHDLRPANAPGTGRRSRTCRRPRTPPRPFGQHNR